MRFGKNKKNRIKITGVIHIDVKTQTIFFNVLTKKDGKEKFFENLFINLGQPVCGRVISSSRKFSLRVNNYLPDLRLLEVKIYTLKSPGKIYGEAIYQVPLDF